MDDYVANSLKFSEETTRVAILTGPNMAGKSTLCYIGQEQCVY